MPPKRRSVAAKKAHAKRIAYRAESPPPEPYLPPASQAPEPHASTTPASDDHPPVEESAAFNSENPGGAAAAAVEEPTAAEAIDPEVTTESSSMKSLVTTAVEKQTAAEAVDPEVTTVSSSRKRLVRRIIRKASPNPGSNKFPEAEPEFVESPVPNVSPINGAASAPEVTAAVESPAAETLAPEATVPAEEPSAAKTLDSTSVTSASGGGGSRKRIVRKIDRKVVPKANPKEGTPNSQVLSSPPPSSESREMQPSHEVAAAESCIATTVEERAASDALVQVAAPVSTSRKKIVKKIIRMGTSNAKSEPISAVAIKPLTSAGEEEPITGEPPTVCAPEAPAPDSANALELPSVNPAPLTEDTGFEPTNADASASKVQAVELVSKDVAPALEPVQKKTVMRVRKVVKKKIVVKRVPKNPTPGRERCESVHETCISPVPSSIIPKFEQQEDAKDDSSCRPFVLARAVEGSNPNPELRDGTHIPSSEADVAAFSCPSEDMDQEPENIVSCEVKDTRPDLGKRRSFDADCDGGEEQGISERRKRRKTEIYIGGLHRDAKEEDIRQVFGRAGEIVEVRMMMESHTGKNKGYAFLRYAESAQAKMAVSDLEKVEVCGKACRVSASVGNDTIFLGNIEKNWKKNDIVKLLDDIGIENIDTITLLSNPENTELNRGFAFLELKTNRDAQLAYRKLQKKDAFGIGQNVKVAWAEPWKEPDDEEMQKVKSVFVEGVPHTWDEEKMSKIFEKFGCVDRIVLARNMQSAKRKDFAFVNFKTRESALSCIELFDKEELFESGQKANLKISLARPVLKSREGKVGPNSIKKEKLKEGLRTAESYAMLNLSSSKGEALKASQKSHGEDMLSSTRKLVETFGHQATTKQGQIGYLKGMSVSDYSQGLLQHGKRHFDSVSNGAHYPYLRAHPRPRADNSHLASSSSYGVSPYVTTGSTLPYNHRPGFGDSIGFMHRAAQHPRGNIQTQRTVQRSGGSSSSSSSGFNTRY